MIFSPTVLAHVVSETRPGVVHQIRMGADGNVYCTCEAWRFQRLPVRERSCKHLRAFACQANLPFGMQHIARMMAAMMNPAPPPVPQKRMPKTSKTNPWTAPLG